MNAQVNPPSAGRQFPVNSAAGVDDSLKKCHENQVRHSLFVLKSFLPYCGVLSPEVLEIREEFFHVQTAFFRIDRKLIFLMIHVVSHAQIPHHDFLVNRTGRGDSAVFAFYQSQILNKSEIII